MLETEAWVPKTRLGMLVKEGKISSLHEIFSKGLRIKEPEIVDMLVTDLKQEILDVNIVQRKTDAGNKTSFRTVVAVGNEDGFVGVGKGNASQVRDSVLKATNNAKLNIIPVRRGCGSWECDCKNPHSIPFKVKGKCGSVRVNLIPAPRGLGLVACDIVKTILRLAGIKDCWARVRGETRTSISLAFATFDSLKKTHLII